jgi:hypothetical protein
MQSDNMTEDTKDLIITLLLADTPNTSGRIFPPEVLQRMAEDCSTKSIFGQIDNDDSTLSGRINLTKVTHAVEDIKYDPISKELIGTIKFLDTPYGAHAKVAWYSDAVKFSPIYYVNEDGSLQLVMVNMVQRD